ncbi:glycosyltransferase family 1 protein [Flavobacterium piscinae]|uniref:Glycosyltransferase family 1 protein n=1 Tax=Flavobacterium piscinae TaxID=2506424 RepID=A0A4Q1KSW0_9FLAO|nr:glycosyltransferase family 4 protein [Flavobacterium piscinae]RXR33072.1 glycosyltransferase family 1 protein [Flavobacterium piscinae]
MRKFKIAIYCGEIPPPTFIDRLINGLAEQGSKLIIIGNLTQKVSYEFNNIKIVGYSGKINKFFILMYYSLLLSLFRRKEKTQLKNWMKLNNKNNTISKIRYYPILYDKPDVFHLQWIKGIEDWVWVRDFDIKLIVSLRGAHINYTPICEPKYAEIYKKYFPLVDGFHGVSNEIIQEATKYNAEISKSNTVYSGLDLNYLTFNQQKPTNEVFQILSVGRSHWIKGYTVALDAMRILKNNNVKFHYTIVGVGQNEELQFQRKQLDLINEVEFVEKLPFDKIISKIQQSDVVLLPSFKEGIANVILESMALGTPVISTDCGGINEVVNDNENGFIVPIRNPEVMAIALQKVANLDESTYVKIINNARNSIENNHTESKMIQDMMLLYKKSYGE